MKNKEQFDSRQSQEQLEAAATQEEVLETKTADFPASELLVQNVVVAEEDFDKEVYDEQGRLIPPSPERQEALNANIEKLGRLFDGSGVNWTLDGGVNIPLMNKGEYTRNHKDFDVSVEKEEIGELEEHLKTKGYGFFISEIETQAAKGKEFKLRRVGSRVISKAHDDSENNPELHLMIGAVDEKGRVRQDESLNLVDIHIVKRDKNGRPLGATNSNLPKEWFEPNPIDFRGTAINLSHPAKVAYFKLHTPDQIGPDGKQRRKYDLEDIEKLVEIGQLSLKEIERIDLILGIESNIQLTKGKRLLRPVLEKITEEMSGEAIFQAFTKEDWAQERFRSDKDGGFAKRLRDFSEEVAKMSDKSLEGIFQKLEERYYRDSDNLFLNKIVKLKKQAKHRDDIEKVRASFDKITKRDDDVNEKQKKETANLSGNAYEILGVSEESSDEEIKAAFRKKIKHFHPDRLPDRRKEGYDYTKEFLGQATQEIKSAYESIKNEEARIIYNEEKSGGLSEKDWQWLKWLAPQAYARKKAKEEEAIREAQRKRDMRERETREEERKRTAPERRAQRLAEERIQRQIKQKEAAQAEAEKMNKINQPETDENIQGREWRKVFKKEIEDLSRDVADLKKQLRELYSYKEMPRGSSGRYYIDLLVKANEQAEDIERQEKEFFDRAHSYFYEKYKGNVDNDAVGKEENTDRTSFFADLTKDITRCQLTILEIRIKLGIHSRFFEEK